MADPFQSFEYLSLSQQLRIANYLDNHLTRKLHIGCGSNILAGWLNTDHEPENSDVLFMDASKEFPFDDCKFDYIFSEHMIEHFSYEEGCSILRNCYRVLKPNGKIRIATPNLAKIIALYTKDKTDEQEEYIRVYIDAFYKNTGLYHPTFVINNNVRNWGHTFIYDPEILKMALESIGFIDISFYPLAISNDEHLKDLECRRNFYDYYDTMVLEATRLL
jgi:predicted SAM-dependent methyltransferase